MLRWDNAMFRNHCTFTAAAVACSLQASSADESFGSEAMPETSSTHSVSCPAARPHGRAGHCRLFVPHLGLHVDRRTPHQPTASVDEFADQRKPQPAAG
jgi:hypothetical protein